MAFIIDGYEHGTGLAEHDSWALELGGTAILDLAAGGVNLELNWPDVHLGYLGAQYGNALRENQTLNRVKNRKYRRHWIDALCKRLSWSDPFPEKQ